VALQTSNRNAGICEKYNGYWHMLLAKLCGK